MTKSEALRYVNLFLALSVLIQAATGLFIFFDIKIPNKAIQEFFLDLHAYNGLVLFVLVLSHVYLNWNWIRVTFFTAKKKPAS